MIAKNLLHQAILRGYSARFVVASDMLHDLAAQDSSLQLARRLRRYTSVPLLCIDEVGYLSYDTRYADLLFEVITRRYQQRATVLTTNKPLWRMEPGLPQRRLRRHARRSTGASLRDPRHRRRQLSPQGSSGSGRGQSRAARRSKKQHDHGNPHETQRYADGMPALELCDDRRRHAP